MTEPAPRTCWIVTDGRRGIENQALGLAEAVGRLVPLTIVRRVAPARDSWRADLAARLRPASLSDLETPDGEAPTHGPDLWIGCGRASLPYSERARGWFGDACLVVQLQDPRRPLDAFDLVIPPEHDRLEGPNVFPIIGAPNRVSDAWLAEGRAAFESAPDAPPEPRAAFLIGGDSKRHRLTSETLAALIDAIGIARRLGWSILATTSRRTPPSAVDALRSTLEGSPRTRIWTSDADGANPYPAFLAAADLVLVTQDSANMITEAATAGKPTLLLPMAGEDGKLGALYAALEARGNLKRYDGEFEPWPAAPLHETDRAAAEVVRRLNAKT